jgi:flagellar biosynthesis protein FlhF
VLNIADYSKKGLTYVTVGQNVPDDIREANTQWLARSILGDGVICYD